MSCPRESLGRLYEKGLGVEKDLQQAADWYARTDAQNAIGRKAMQRLKDEHGIVPRSEPEKV